MRCRSGKARWRTKKRIRRRRPAGGPSRSRCRPRSYRRGPRARESMDKEEERASPVQCDFDRAVAKDPVPRCARPAPPTNTIAAGAAATTPSSSASGPNARAPSFAPNRNRAPPVQCGFDRGGIEVDPVPRCARPTPPTTPANPAPRRPHQPPNLNSRSGDGGQQAAPAGRSDCGSLC